MSHQSLSVAQIRKIKGAVTNRPASRDRRKWLSVIDDALVQIRNDNVQEGTMRAVRAIARSLGLRLTHTT